MAAAVNQPTVARDAVDARALLMAGQAVKDLDPALFAGPAQEAVEAAVIDGAMVYSTDTHRIITGFSRDVPMQNGDTLFVLDKRVAINDCEAAVAQTTAFWDAGTWTDATMPTGRPVLRVAGAAGVKGRAFLTSADVPSGDLEMLVLQRTFGKNSAQCGITLRGRVAQSGYTIGSGGGTSNPRLTIYRRFEGVATFAAGITWDFPFGSTYEEHAAWIRARVDGGRVRAKAWKVTETEPAGWMLDWTDPSPLQPGWAGVFNADTTTADWGRVSWNANGGSAP
ncbi:hypothetical protein [Microbacterium resistens]